ncbi:MAG: tetratricopeptide repeat protein [Caulobacter sp.]|nr:tetratricopeptide repeat protein [Caulobacter sp.]
MCRMQARLATVLAPLLASSVLMAASAHAADKPVAPSAPAMAPEAPRKAGPAERDEMRRADPLTRMAFWSTEADRDGRDVEAGVGLVAYEQAKRDDEALAAHRQAVALAPAEAVPLTNLAMHLASTGDLPGAEKLLRQAAALPTATIQVRQNLALVVGLQGRIDEAEKLARQDLPPESVDNNLAWLRAAVGQSSATRSWDAVKAGG